MDKFKNKDFLFYLLHWALVEFREEGYTIKNKKIFRISDFLHNLPLKLNDANNDKDYIEILKHLKDKGEHDGIDKWFESILMNYEKRNLSEDGNQAQPESSNF